MASKSYIEKLTEEHNALQDSGVLAMAQSVATQRAIIGATAKEAAEAHAFEAGTWRQSIKRRVTMQAFEGAERAAQGINPDGSKIVPPEAKVQSEASAAPAPNA